MTTFVRFALQPLTSFFFCGNAASDIDRAMLNVLEENARLLNQIEANILTSQVGILYVLVHRSFGCGGVEFILTIPFRLRTTLIFSIAQEVTSIIFYKGISHYKRYRF